VARRSPWRLACQAADRAGDVITSSRQHQVNRPMAEPDGTGTSISGQFPTDALRAFDGVRYLNLETYRGNGVGVRTPVWFATGPKDSPGFGVAKYYIYTTADSGKVRRVRRNGVVRIAPCDIRGNVTGPWINAIARPVTGTEFELGMRLLDRKYFPWKQILNLSARLFRRRERIVLAIQPAPTDPPPAS
jgi:PPOX class probable F420-dependent enzyme